MLTMGARLLDDPSADDRPRPAPPERIKIAMIPAGAGFALLPERRYARSSAGERTISSGKLGFDCDGLARFEMYHRDRADRFMSARSARSPREIQSMAKPFILLVLLAALVTAALCQ
jgi:hypothetical protein